MRENLLSGPIPDDLEEEVERRVELSDSNDNDNDNDSDTIDNNTDNKSNAEEKINNSFNNIDLSGLPLKKQLLSFEFILIVCFTLINMTWLNLHIGTIEQQLNYKLGHEKGIGNPSIYLFIPVSIDLFLLLLLPIWNYIPLAVEMTIIFNIVLPFGFLASPLVGYIIDNKSLSLAFLILTSSLFLMWIINLTSLVWLHILNFFFYTWCRAYLYSGTILPRITSYC